MGFNKFGKADALRITAMLLLLAIVYCGFGSSLRSTWKEIIFRLPAAPPTITSTPIPTNTRIPLPTATPGPTSTFTLTPIPTSAFLPGKLLSFWNEFDNTDVLRGDWVFSSNVKVKDGLLVLEHTNNWSGVYGNPHLQDGQAVLVQFRFDTWSDIHIAVETGEFQTDSYRSWGIGAENNIFSAVSSEGTIEYENSFTADDRALDSGKWYVLMLHIGGKNPFKVQIWEKDNPANMLSFETEENESWVGQKWLPLFLVGPTGKLEIERYEELKGYTP